MATLNLKNLASAVEEFRRLDDDVPTRVLTTFLLIADAPGTGMSDIQRRMGVNQAAISRQVSHLMEWRSPRTPGLNLVRTEIDPNNRKFRLCFLTPKGEKVRDSILK